MVNKYDDDGLMVMMTTTLELCYCVILHSKRYGMVICLERGADLHMAQLLPLPLSLASVKSRLVIPFWYRLNRVVPDKGPLNGCVCIASASLLPTVSQKWLKGDLRIFTTSWCIPLNDPFSAPMRPRVRLLCRLVAAGAGARC